MGEVDPTLALPPSGSIVLPLLIYPFINPTLQMKRKTLDSLESGLGYVAELQILHMTLLYFKLLIKPSNNAFKKIFAALLRYRVEREMIQYLI
jgi:hypothetical protein